MSHGLFLSTEGTEFLSTEHTEDTDRRKLSTELFWKLLRKKSLEEIFNKNMAYGQKLFILYNL